MCDADGATAFADVEVLLARLRQVQNKQGHGIGVGSRAHLEEEAVATVRSVSLLLLCKLSSLTLRSFLFFLLARPLCSEAFSETF